MSQLILLRHGQSMWNAANLFTGWVDVPLSQTGIDEAINAGKQMADLDIDVIFTSTLIRAQQTVMLAMAQHHSKKTPIMQHQTQDKQQEWGEIFATNLNEDIIPTYIAWELNERYYGELQGKNKTETREQYGDEQVKIWRRSYDVAPPNGESLKMTAERTLPYFNEYVVPELEQGKNVLIGAHGNSLRSIIMEIEKLSPNEILALELATGVPRLYQYQNQQFVHEES